MNKAKLLRTALTSALPELRKDPDRLKLWVENGSARSRQTATLGFAFQYRLNVLIAEASTDIALIALALFRWIRVQQPSLLAVGSEGISFDADILDNGTADILFQLELVENISVSPKDSGGFTLDYLTEPDPLMMDELGFGGTAPIPPLDQVDTSATPSP